MKHIYIFFLTLLAISFPLSAQVPPEFRYQARIADQTGHALVNQTVNVHLVIRQGDSDNGTQVFEEDHQVITSADGMIALSVGSINDLSIIDWSAGPYFLQISVDGHIMGSSQILAVPYTLHAGVADSVKHISYDDLYGRPDFTAWDKNAADDFDGDYNSLINKPLTITMVQSAKLDSITVTNRVDLDELKSQADSNSTKVSFPGFGKMPGKALEGDQVIWSKVDTNVFYNQGNVGINVPVNSDFGGSVLHVGGGILYDGIPASGNPGLMFYDTTGSGAFKYFDDKGTMQDISAGTLTYDGLISGSDQGDITLNNDLILKGSLAVGNDVVNGEDFGYSTILLKENNLRILFDDTDDPAGTYPSNDWQIIINDSNNGGENYFAVSDVTHDHIPFKIMGGAPDNAFIVDENGNVGIGTKTPANALEVEGTVKADAFIGDGSGLTGITGGTGGISNADTTVIAADNDANFTGMIDFQTQDTSRMVIVNNGKVGIGTSLPQSQLDVRGSVYAENVNVVNSTTVASLAITLKKLNITGTPSLVFDATGQSLVSVTADVATTIEAFSGGIAGQTLTLINAGSNNITVKNNGSGMQKVLLPGPDIVLGAFQSATFICSGAEWYCTVVQN